ncbi:MAG: flagellar basal body L-ring protein FlgH [Bdellovibrionales bacterium]|nr:flagellar basal body L-ring protein FlgH [Bdellovibrionales bacterium]
MKNIKLTSYVVFFTCALLLSGCSSIAKSWKSLISGDSEEKAAPRTRAVGSSYSQQNNLLPSTYRKYKRTTKKDLEDNAHLESKSGSLWVMEGQGAYLFSQNIVRMIGDPIGIILEGDPSEQLASKAKVISDLLAQLEERRRRALGRAPASDAKKDESSTDAKAPGGVAAQANPTNVGVAAPTADAKDFNVKMVPTRVVERLVDGNYRVRGTQPFMIGTREYKVIVSGIVRAEDFNDKGISASQLLDSSFDIVSSKSSEMR